MVLKRLILPVAGFFVITFATAAKAEFINDCLVFGSYTTSRTTTEGCTQTYRVSTVRCREAGSTIFNPRFGGDETIAEPLGAPVCESASSSSGSSTVNVSSGSHVEANPSVYVDTSWSGTSGLTAAQIARLGYSRADLERLSAQDGYSSSHYIYEKLGISDYEANNYYANEGVSVETLVRSRFAQKYGSL